MSSDNYIWKVLVKQDFSILKYINNSLQIKFK
jgi:hypothetical protein